VGRSGGGEAVEHRGELAGPDRYLVDQNRDAGPRQHRGGQDLDGLVEQHHRPFTRPALSRCSPLLAGVVAQRRDRVGGEHLPEHRLVVVVLGVVEAVRGSRAEQHPLHRQRERPPPGQPRIVEAAHPGRAADHGGPPAQHPGRYRVGTTTQARRPRIASADQLRREVDPHCRTLPAGPRSILFRLPPGSAEGERLQCRREVPTLRMRRQVVGDGDR
jgi:hypothetical protein